MYPSKLMEVLSSITPLGTFNIKLLNCLSVIELTIFLFSRLIVYLFRIQTFLEISPFGLVAQRESSGF